MAVQDPAFIYDGHQEVTHTVEVISRLYKTGLHHRLHGCDQVYMRHIEVVRTVVSCKLVQKQPSSVMKCTSDQQYLMVTVREFTNLLGDFGQLWQINSSPVSFNILTLIQFRTLDDSSGSQNTDKQCKMYAVCVYLKPNKTDMMPILLTLETYMTKILTPTSWTPKFS